MTYSDPLPTRVRVLVIGGGIHGVGLLHDMASREWRDIHLIEKSTIGSGTSSKSTKLIHGGLRYLRRIRDFGLVAEALHERHLLLKLAPDIIKPLELLFPTLKSGGVPRAMIKTGLMLYDRLAGRSGIHAHATLTAQQAQDRVPILDMEKVQTVYSFWDGQVDDLRLVERVASSARILGAGISEGVEAIKAVPNDDGWDVTVRNASGEAQIVSALYVVNAAGPWSNRFLESSGIVPPFQGINNKGSHAILPHLGLKAGLFLQSTQGDGRIFFLLPWEGQTLLGTTEDLFSEDPDLVAVEEKEILYLLENCNQFLKKPLSRQDVKGVFAGLRWLAIEPGHSISDTSRAYCLGERAGKRGLMLTLYGGKLTTYRNLSRIIGDRITKHFGEFQASATDDPANWVDPAKCPSRRDPVERFINIRTNSYT